MSGQRRGFAGDAFHHVAIAAQRVDIEVEQFEVRDGCRSLPATRLAIAMPTLVETPWPSGPVVLSTPVVQPYSGCPGQRLPAWRKVLSRRGSRLRRSELFVAGLVGLDAGQMDQRVEQHGGMAAGEHEAIAIGPRGLLRDRNAGRAATTVYAVGAAPNGVPGCPELAFCTPSIARRANGIDGQLIDLAWGFTCLLWNHSLTSLFRGGRLVSPVFVAVPVNSCRIGAIEQLGAAYLQGSSPISIRRKFRLSPAG